MADPLPFQEAIDFLAGKVNLPTRRYDDLMHGAHVRAFSVAGVTRDDMLTDFRRAMEKARTAGTGYNEFRKDFDSIVDRTGWVFKARGKTEEERRDWRARVIFNTNMRTSYMAGRYAQMTDPDVLRYRPNWQYVHSGALHPRKQHLAWDGQVWAATDPIWKYIFPPNGFGCGCDVEALSGRDLKALGKSGPDPSPDLKFYDGRDPRTGEPEPRVGGIDRGWEYNVGQEWLSGVVPKALRNPLPAFDPDMPALVDLPPLPSPTLADAADILPIDVSPETAVDAFLQAFGLLRDESRIFRDASGGIVTISQSLFEWRTPEGVTMGLKADKRDRGQYARLLAATIRTPDEIWANWAKVASGVILRRTYLKRMLLPDGTSLLVSFEWTSKGWVARTGFDAGQPGYFERQRRGALLYRRKE